MKVVVFGANGPTGRLLVTRLLEAGHHPVAVTRRPESFPAGAPGISVLGADAVMPDSVLGTLEDADAVISTLGVPFTREPVTTFSAGTSAILAAMNAKGIRRIVVVSSTGAHHYRNRRKSPLSLRFFEPVISHTIGKTVYEDLRRMEAVVQDSRLDWTIVRPSTLFDAEKVSRYTAGLVAPIGAFTARIDLADYLATVLTDRASFQTTPIISTTEGAPTFLQNLKNQMARNR